MPSSPNAPTTPPGRGSDDRERDGEIVADDNDDADSSIGDEATSDSLTSIRSSILAFHEENGRTYHSMSAGKYFLPNDAVRPSPPSEASTDIHRTR
jgi:hypothetical protein